MMSDTTQIALISSGAAVISGLIATLGVILNGMITRRAVRVSRAQSHEEHARTGEKVQRTEVKLEAVEQKTNTIIEKAAEIHTLTNSTLSTTTAALAVANTEIKGLVKAQEIANQKNEELQALVLALMEQEKHTEQAVKETNGILRKDSGPLPVVDEQLAKKIDGIVTPKLNKLQDTVDEK